MTLDARKPADVADELAAEAPDQSWLRELIAELDQRLRTRDLDRFLTLWDLSLSQASDAFGVSRQALSKWRREGVPAARMPALGDLIAATERLERRVKRERIPAVVRRPADALDGRSLLELARSGRHAEVPEAVERMFDLRCVQP